MKAVAFDLRRAEIQLGENLAKREAGGGGSRTTRPRNGNNRMSGRHSNSLTGKVERSAVKRVAGHDIDRLMQFRPHQHHVAAFKLAFNIVDLLLKRTFMFTIIGAFTQDKAFDQIIERFGRQILPG